MRTASRGLRRARLAALGCIAALALVACTSDEKPRPSASDAHESSCSIGSPDPTEAVRNFLAAVQEEDQDSARQFLQPGGEIPAEAWDKLGVRLEGVALDELKFTSEQMATAVSLRAIMSDGSVLGTFEAHFQEDAPQCAAVVWGTYPDEPGADASEPASA